MIRKWLSKGHHKKKKVQGAKNGMYDYEHLTKEEIAAAKFMSGLKDFNISKVFIDATYDAPDGERFYDPIVEEIWG